MADEPWLRAYSTLLSEEIGRIKNSKLDVTSLDIRVGDYITEDNWNSYSKELQLSELQAFIKMLVIHYSKVTLHIPISGSKVKTGKTELNARKLSKALYLGDDYNFGWR